MEGANRAVTLDQGNDRLFLGRIAKGFVLGFAAYISFVGLATIGIGSVIIVRSGTALLGG